MLVVKCVFSFSQYIIHNHYDLCRAVRDGCAHAKRESRSDVESPGEWVGKPFKLKKVRSAYVLYTLACVFLPFIEQRLQNEVNDKASRIVRLEEEMSKAKNDGLAKDSETSQLKVRLMQLLFCV